MVTILTDAGVTDVAAAAADGDALWLADDAAATTTGWTMKAEGFCKEDVCVPVPPADADAFVRPGQVNVARFWRHMEMPVVHDAAGDTWVLGEGATQRTQRLMSLEAPDFTLPDLDGREHSLSDFMGKKVFLSTWASW